MKKFLFNQLIKILLYPAPTVLITKEEEKQFINILENGINSDRELEYSIEIPKYKFLYYLTKEKNIVLHGSNHKTIQQFEPREQTLFNNETVKAVFATKDPIWPMFYAILNKENIVDNFRNGCLRGKGRNYHFYSLTKETVEKDPWMDGMLYLLPSENFSLVGKGPVSFDEWISYEYVKPIAKIQIQPKDFYFINKVSTHNINESLIKTWFLYKIRTILKKIAPNHSK